MTNQVSWKKNPLLQWVLQAKRIPLLYAVTIVSGIFYHYAPKWTPVWILLSILLQGGLFALFGYVKKHPVLGGFIYVAVGCVFAILAMFFIRAGYSGAVFGPKAENSQIAFYVWFLTPQSVLVTGYPGYTLALYMFFMFFIASVSYYFTFVRYRVLMSFMVMLFPFAIYAKEAETMPIPSIIILLVGYFAVMVYCRQAHAEDHEVVQKYDPEAVSTLRTPGKKSAFAGVRPEVLDGKFITSSGIFLAAASILILVLPKPTVQADRDFLDTMLDMSTLSDYLMNAISGFAESSNGGDYSMQNFTRTLYYAQAREPLNLTEQTFTNYSYDDDTWYMDEAYDDAPQQTDPDYLDMGTYSTMRRDPVPAELIKVLHNIAKTNSDYAERWGLTNFAAMELSDSDAYIYELYLQAAAYNWWVYPAVYNLQSVDVRDRNNNLVLMYQNATGVLFRYAQYRSYGEEFSMSYHSDRYAGTEAAKELLLHTSIDTWGDMLTETIALVPANSADYKILMQALDATMFAENYRNSVISQTPDSVKKLAAELTQGCRSDMEKAAAIQTYLAYSGGFTYSKEFLRTDADNVETFLFNNKKGVCYQFASAMTELCRAAGLIVRYEEGLSMTAPDDRLIGGGKWDYAITTEHQHAFVHVFVPGYGWLMFDATAPSGDMAEEKANINVIATLQYSGMILFAITAFVVFVLAWLVPVAREKYFRSQYQKQRNAAVVQDAFSRLCKQWKADPAETARALCAEKSVFLGIDLEPLCSGFESAVYANRCTPDDADRLFRIYCAAYDAWKPAVKRERKARREAWKQKYSRRESV